MIMSWGGILFDLLIIPALIWKPTRNIAFVISVAFHLMNSITFQIGTFPYMMIGACTLFYPAQKLRKLFKLNIRYDSSLPTLSAHKSKLITVSFVVFFTFQIILPLRHYIIPGNVFWTEEGHKLSWRMMLRSKRGSAVFNIIKPNGQKLVHNAKKDMTYKQYHIMCTHPDMIWQYCQFLKKNTVMVFKYM